MGGRWSVPPPGLEGALVQISIRMALPICTDMDRTCRPICLFCSTKGKRLNYFGI